MNFFQFGGQQQGNGQQPAQDETQQILMSGDIWIFVAFWLGLTVLTGSIFFYVYVRSRRGLARPGGKKGPNSNWAVSSAV